MQPLYMHVYIYIRMHIYTYIYIYIHTYIMHSTRYICVYIYLYMCIHMSMYVFSVFGYFGPLHADTGPEHNQADAGRLEDPQALRCLHR